MFYMFLRLKTKHPTLHRKVGCNLFKFTDFQYFAERQALELILSQNIIKLQTTDNQV